MVVVEDPARRFKMTHYQIPGQFKGPPKMRLFLYSIQETNNDSENFQNTNSAGSIGPDLFQCAVAGTADQHDAELYAKHNAKRHAKLKHTFEHDAEPPPATATQAKATRSRSNGPDSSGDQRRNQSHGELQGQPGEGGG